MSRSSWISRCRLIYRQTAARRIAHDMNDDGVALSIAKPHTTQSSPRFNICSGTDRPTWGTVSAPGGDGLRESRNVPGHHGWTFHSTRISRTIGAHHARRPDALQEPPRCIRRLVGRLARRARHGRRGRRRHRRRARRRTLDGAADRGVRGPRGGTHRARYRHGRPLRARRADHGPLRPAPGRRVRSPLRAGRRRLHPGQPGGRARRRFRLRLLGPDHRPDHREHRRNS